MAMRFAYDFTTLEGDGLWDDYQVALAERA